MEIDDDYINLDIEDIQLPHPQESGLYAKKTLLYSPIFNNIFPQFYVSTSNRIRNIRNLSLHDDDLQYMALQEEDSQFGVFSDDEMLFEEDREVPQDDNSPVKLETIEVIVRNSSILVDNNQFAFNTSVRASCIIRGIKNEIIQEEDSLLVSLKSGFLLLIRMFYVPKDFSDSADEIPNQKPGRRLVFKPFVVQWWDTSSKLLTPSLFTSGFSLSAHCTGLAVVSTSACGSLRIYACDHTENGLFFQNHETVPVDGSILHSCFARPIKGSVLDDHVMFLTLLLTTENRLIINLYSWTSSEKIAGNLTVSKLPLDGSFPLPIFIVPLGNNGSFLFVHPKEFVIITVHDITSAEYNFNRLKYDGPFPTNFYCPTTNIVNSDEENSDEVLISTDYGTIYSMVISNGQFMSFKPIVRISDPISLFSFEATDKGYELIYGSSVGLNRKLIIEELLPDLSNSVIPYSLSLLENNYRNWAPILDITVVDSYNSKNNFPNSKQELWCLSGIGKRARLLQLRSGISITRSSDAYQSLRKVESMYQVDIGETSFVVCSLPFETVLLEIQINEDDEEELVEVDDAALVLDNPTIVSKKVTDDLMVQVTAKSVILTSLEEIITSKEIESGWIVLSDVKENIVATVSVEDRNDDSVPFYTVRILELGDTEIKDKSSMSLLDEISLIKLVEVKNNSVVIIGGFDAQGSWYIDFYNLKDLSKLFSLKSPDQNQADEMDLNQCILVPSDVYVDQNKLFVGTKSGTLFVFEFSDTEFVFKKRLRLSDVGIEFYSVGAGLLACCGSLWYIDLSGPIIPKPVLLDERSDKPVKAVLPINIGNRKNGDIPLLITRDEGLSFFWLSTSSDAVIRQINLGDSAKKVIYLPHLHIFAITSASKDRTARLRYVDRRSYKLLSHREQNSKNKKYENGEAMFEEDEMPLSVKVWSLDKIGRVSKKLLVGCSKGVSGGSFKILDITKVMGHDNKPQIVVTQLNYFDLPGPINCVEQVDSHIIFSCGKSVYSTSYNLEEKRLNPVSSLLSLTSDITSISVDDDKLITITTKLDSIYQFHFELDGSLNQILRLHARDPSPKSVVNHATMNSKVVIGDKVHSNVIVMDKLNTNLSPVVRFKTSGVPRVFVGDFSPYWLDSDASPSIIAVTVDGEVTLFKQIDPNTEEYENLKVSIPTKPNPSGELEFSTERWDIAFIDKVAGKGFKSINKPYFRNRDNKKKIIDYDLEEISKNCDSYISL